MSELDKMVADAVKESLAELTQEEVATVGPDVLAEYAETAPVMKAVFGTSIEEGAEPLYREGDYAVFVARINGAVSDKPDMDHYLIINTRYNVIEGSSNRIIDARAGAWALSHGLNEQDARINAGLPLVVTEEQNVGKRNKSWPQAH